MINPNSHAFDRFFIRQLSYDNKTVKIVGGREIHPTKPNHGTHPIIWSFLRSYDGQNQPTNYNNQTLMLVHNVKNKTFKNCTILCGAVYNAQNCTFVDCKFVQAVNLPAEVVASSQKACGLRFVGEQVLSRHFSRVNPSISRWIKKASHTLIR